MAPAPETVDTFAQARAALVRPDFFKTRKWRDQKLVANRDGACEEILLFEHALTNRLASMGIPVFAHCVVRTPEEQDRLFRLGHSKAKAGESPHQYGFAVDIVHSVFAWNLPTNPNDRRFQNKCWSLIGEVGKQCAKLNKIDIEWGGGWKFYDPAHWQIRDWRERVASSR